VKPLRAVALRLDIRRRRESEYTIKASIPGSGKAWINRMPAFSLDDSRLGYAEALSEFKRLVGPDLEPVDWDRLDMALQGLRLISGRLITALAGSRIASFRKFVEMALNPLYNPPSAPLVEVHAPSALLFPFELIQIRSGDWPHTIRDRESLLCACTTFLGFSAAVRRVFTDLAGGEEGLDQNRILRNRGRLRITLFQEARTLQGARTEAAFFCRHGELFSLRTWPQQNSTSIAFGLATQLWDSRTGLDGAKPQLLPDEIQHFACHCATADPDPLQHAFRLAAQTGQPCVVTLGELDAQFGLAGQKATEDPPRPGPLVFLNACASAVMAAGFGTSFVRWFLRNRNRGVIGTETLIPDTFASAFSAQFYTAILKKEPIGQALITTKRHMVRQYGNPLGMVYTMYADPDLQVEIKIDEELFNE
jgi:hypothetical protein